MPHLIEMLIFGLLKLISRKDSGLRVHAGKGYNSGVKLKGGNGFANWIDMNWGPDGQSTLWLN